MSNATPPDANELLSIVSGIKSEASFNPWLHLSDDDLGPESLAFRREAFLSHFSLAKVTHVLCGEALGYQGGRVTGLAFTSEHLLLEGSIPRQLLQKRLSSRPMPWREPSATIVWKALYRFGIADTTLLFNAYPLHPHSITNRQTNRAPSKLEIQSGLPCLEWIRSQHPTAQFISVGQHASTALAKLGISSMHARHPAYGGATEFSNAIQAAAQPRPKC